MKKTLTSSLNRGFTLLETVIAIGVLAVLLTGFIVVFAPAAAGIKKAISVQEADRLASTIENELVTLRPGQQTTLEPKSSTSFTGFDKAFSWVMRSNVADTGLLVYQYRGSLTATRTDDSPEPVADMTNKLPGKDYNLVTMMRRKNDQLLKADMPAIEGGIYLVKCTQLTFKNGELSLGEGGKIVDPKSGSNTAIADPDSYPEAVIAFNADFYTLPAKSSGFLDSPSGFAKSFTNAKNPVFSRNLAVRR